MSTREKREQRKAQKARFVAMYPGLSHDEIIEECLKGRALGEDFDYCR